MLKISILDKHAIFRTGLSIVLQNEYPDSIITQSNTLTYTHSQDHELIIFGVNNINDILELNTKIEDVIKKVPVIVILESIFKGPQIADLLNFRANGYLTKTLSIHELISCISVALKGGAYTNREILLSLEKTSVPSKHRIPPTES
ncbi:hypothetical protein [Dyadobacter sp. CY312]|uniref:hypothetical protein n=1 Tax=Dyadobacter sp. CY312 TaxID=2907303 RepID=UPI001F36F831|nr:hypothetical protein [Dyadobacter sp. CY312]MCE7044578.1 hypothetical protein [Dyadobacter sp. CY312]